MLAAHTGSIFRRSRSCPGHYGPVLRPIRRWGSKIVSAFRQPIRRINERFLSVPLNVLLLSRGCVPKSAGKSSKACGM